MLKNKSKILNVFFMKDLTKLLEGTSIEEIAREMIDNYDEYEEVLDIEPEIMFESKYRKTYYYAYVNN